jgi:hypothetical protein
MTQRIERQPPGTPGRIVTEDQRNITVHHLVQDDREDCRHRPD